MDPIERRDVAFGPQCEGAVIRFLADSQEVVGCVAWLTNPHIVDAIAGVPDHRIVVTADIAHNRPRVGLRRLVVRQVGRARGRYRLLMHHKFMVRITDGVPTHVMIGSYNYTRRSNSNIGESIVVIRSETCAQMFADEHARAWLASRPIRYNVGPR